MSKIEKSKNHNGETIFPVTVADAVLMGNGQTPKGKLSELSPISKQAETFLFMKLNTYITKRKNRVVVLKKKPTVKKGKNTKVIL